MSRIESLVTCEFRLAKMRNRVPLDCNGLNFFYSIIHILDRYLSFQKSMNVRANPVKTMVLVMIPLTHTSVNVLLGCMKDFIASLVSSSRDYYKDARRRWKQTEKNDLLYEHVQKRKEHWQF